MKGSDLIVRAAMVEIMALLKQRLKRRGSYCGENDGSDGSQHAGMI